MPRFTRLKNRPSCLEQYMSYIGEGKEVIRQMYDLSSNCDLFNFYKSQELLGNMKKELMEVAQSVISVAPKSAGQERILNIMGFVYSNLRKIFA